jgi:hypothetical protein
MPVTSDKFIETESTLPDDLRPIFRRFVEEYEYLLIGAQRTSSREAFMARNFREK